YAQVPRPYRRCVVHTKDTLVDTIATTWLTTPNTPTHVRKAAIDILSQRGMTVAIAHIQKFADHPSLQTATMIALYRLGIAVSTEDIMAIYTAQHTPYRTRQAIKRAIIKNKDQRLIPYLIALFKPQENQRDTIRRHLADTNPAEQKKRRHLEMCHQQAIETLGALQAEEAIPHLAYCITRTDYHCKDAMQALTEIGTANARQALVNQLGKYIFDLAAERGDFSEGIIIIPDIPSPSQVLMNCVVSFGRVIEPDLLTIIKEHKPSSDRFIHALQALCRIGSPTATDHVLTLAKKRKYSRQLNQIAPELSYLNDERLVAPIITRLESGNLHDAGGFLAILPTNQLLMYLESEMPNIRREAILALAKKQDPTTINILIELFFTTQYERKEQLRDAIEAIADPHSVILMIDKIISKSYQAYESHYVLDLTLTVDEALAITRLHQHFISENETARDSAAMLFAFLGDTRVADYLYSKLNAAQLQEHKQKYGYALAELGDKRAIPYLITQLNLELYQRVEHACKTLHDYFPENDKVTKALYYRLLAFTVEDFRTQSVISKLIYALVNRGEEGISSLEQALEKTSNPVVREKIVKHFNKS
ncbi:MAG: hypothetical protein AAFV98_00715, partial [Chloroflexota bacterium]